MNEDNIKGNVKKAAGSVESAFGNVTGNKSTEFSGEARKFAGSAQDALGDAEDKVLDLAGRVKGFIGSANDDLSAATSKVNDKIHEKPVQSSLIALGIGFVLGALLIRQPPAADNQSLRKNTPALHVAGVFFVLFYPLDGGPKNRLIVLLCERPFPPGFGANACSLWPWARRASCKDLGKP